MGEHVVEKVDEQNNPCYLKISEVIGKGSQSENKQKNEGR